MRTGDGYIVSKCLNGDSAAFGLLVDKYKEAVYALSYSKLHNFHDAEDVAQEVFITAYRKLHTLRRYDSFHAWIYAITTNLCRRWTRERSRRPDSGFIEDEAAEALEAVSVDSYREQLNREMLYEQVRDALACLSETYRQVLTLYYLGGMNSGEIAEFLGISPAAVWKRLSRARSLLREGTLAGVSDGLKRGKLPTGFTFRIVETVKHIRIKPVPHATNTPWGLSLTTGIIIALVSLSPHLGLLNTSDSAISSLIYSETGTVRTREIPVYVLAEDHRTPIFFDNKIDNDSEGMAWAKKADIPTDKPTSTYVGGAEAAGHTGGHTTNTLEGSGHYIISYYAEIPGRGEMAGGWSEIGASNSELSFGIERTTGIGADPVSEPVPMYVVFRYVNHPDRKLRFSTHVGDEWAAPSGFKSKANTVVESNRDVVTVPAGTFRDCIKLKTVIRDSEGTKEERDFCDGTRYMWFAPGVGLVRLEYYHNDNTTTNIELADYHIPEDSRGYFPLVPRNRWTYEWTNGYRNYRIRETCAIVPTNLNTIKVCGYLLSFYLSEKETSMEDIEKGCTREGIKKGCGFSDEELDAAINPLLEWNLVEWKDGILACIDYGLRAL